MDKNDLSEARRSAEHWLVQEAYDYALANLGFVRDGVILSRIPVGEEQAILDHLRSKLLRRAEGLAAALVVDARLMPLRGLDEVIQRGLTADSVPVESEGE